METFHEVFPFAKEMMSQKLTPGMLKIYLVGSAVAVLGTALGVVQAVCQPFYSDEAVLDAELQLDEQLERDRCVDDWRSDRGPEAQMAERDNYAKPHSDVVSVTQRSSATRLHAS